jgi:hypothetical protein
MFAAIPPPGRRDRRTRRPVALDLAVYEQTATVGPMVAARLGVPVVQQNIAILSTGDAHRATAALLADLCEEYEIPQLPAPLTTIEVIPPSMLSVPAEGWFMGGRPDNGGGVWAANYPGDPRGRRSR